MKIDGDNLILSTGKIVNANKGIVGIVRDEDGFSITGGYDDSVYPDSWRDDDALTEKELVEIADYMIALWQEFKNEH